MDLVDSPICGLNYFVGIPWDDLSTFGHGFVETYTYTCNILITPLIVINTCISKKLFLKRIKTCPLGLESTVDKN